MTPDPHLWVRARFDARALGLLDEADDARFAAHLAECDACAVLAETHRANLPPSPRPTPHLPTTLIATWAHVSAELRGLERRMVREHLESCAECRRDLELLGHASVLASDPALEHTSHAERERADERRPSPRLAVPRPSSRGWWLGGAAGAALATAACVLLYAGPLRRTPSMPSQREFVTPPAGRPDRLELAPPTAVLRAPTRAQASPAAASLTIPAGTSRVALRLPEWSGSGSSPVRVVVDWPEARARCDLTFRFGDLLARRSVYLESGAGPLPPGNYVITTTFGPDPAEPGTRAISVVSRLQLRIAPALR